MAANREREAKESLGRILRTGIFIFGGLLIVFALLAWFIGGDLLPMDYEGFD